MIISFTARAWAGYTHWQETDSKIVKKINFLIKEIARSPYEGAGNPESLRYEFSGYWSRRIDKELRVVYRIVEDTIEIVQCRYHY